MDQKPRTIVLPASTLAPTLVMNADALQAEGVHPCGWDWGDHYHASIQGSAPELLPAYLVLDADGRVYLQGSADEFRKLCARILAALPTTTGLALLADAQAHHAEARATTPAAPPPPTLRLVR